MALKSKLTKAEHDALPDALKEHYKEKDGAFLLESDDAAELRAAKDREAEARRLEKERADKLQKELDDAAAATAAANEEAARKAKDLPAIEASWQAKVDAAVKAGEDKIARLTAMLSDLLVDNKAIELANKISKSPKLILPHIKSRLRAEIDGEVAVTRILDKDGKASALSIEDLEKEFVANKDFADIIKGTNASGGGAGGGSGGDGISGKKFTDLTEAERTALHRSDPQEFRRQAAQAGVTIPS